MNTADQENTSTMRKCIAVVINEMDGIIIYGETET